jgi:hypothetical protein
MARTCTRCVLPEAPPWLTLDGDGVCSACRAPAPAVPAPEEAALLKLIRKRRGKHRYDCVVLCSGGIDSTAALVCMVRHYGVNPLALTLDHGLLSDDALVNVRRAADALRVDHIAYANDLPRRVAAAMLATEQPGIVCAACAPWMLGKAYELAGRFDAPFLVTGWTRPGPSDAVARACCGCDLDRPEYAAAAAATAAFLAAQLDTLAGAKGTPRSLGQLRRKLPRKLRLPVFSPHWYQPPPEGGWRPLLEAELGWRQPAEALAGRSTACALAAVSVHAALGPSGISQQVVALADQVRAGRLGREQALAQRTPSPGRDALAAALDPTAWERS